MRLALAVVKAAHRAAEDGVEDGADGLRRFSPSAFSDALGGGAE